MLNCVNLQCTVVNILDAVRCKAFCPFKKVKYLYINLQIIAAHRNCCLAPGLNNLLFRTKKKCQQESMLCNISCFMYWTDSSIAQTPSVAIYHVCILTIQDPAFMLLCYFDQNIFAVCGIHLKLGRTISNTIKASQVHILIFCE